MVYILFLWLTVKPTAITTQEFATRKDCVKAAVSFQNEFGKDIRFMCIEKGANKK